MSDDCNWLQTIRQQWLKQDGISSEFLHYLIDHQEVPGHIPREPRISDVGKHYVTLSWEKPHNPGGAPILAYKVECYQISGNGKEKWIEVGVSPSTSIDIYSIEPRKKYNFRVTPRNQYGWGKAVSTRTAIEIEEMTEFPEFEKCLPGELKVLGDSSVNLECQLKHYKNTEIRWLKDGKPINDNEKYEFYYKNGKCCLKIKDLNDLDTSRYTCEAFNDHGRTCTFVSLMVVHEKRLVDANLRLNKLRHENNRVDSAPKFTMRLRNRRIQMCYPVRLTCQVIGFPKPIISWSKDGKKIEDNQHFSILEEADGFHTLEINNTKPSEHSGIYSVTATNSSGSVSCKNELIVDKGLRTYIGPKFVDKLEKVYSVQENTELTIRAFLVAYPAVGITWQKNGIQLRQNRRIITTLSHEGEVKLTIAHIKLQDSGIYTCMATNEAGIAETNTRIEVFTVHNVLTPENDEIQVTEEWTSTEPKFLIKPRSCEASEGNRVIINCKIIGDPKPEVTWLRNHMKLDYYRDGHEFIIHKEESALPYEHKLEIPSVKFDHTGAYSLIAKNIHGEIKSIISLQVHPKELTFSQTEEKENNTTYSAAQKLPLFLRPLLDIQCCDGDSVTFACEVEEENLSDIHFFWYKNGKIIPLESDFKFHSKENTASLTIEHVYVEDEGKYSCVATNALGSSSTAAYLIVNVPEENEEIRQRLGKPNHLQSRGHAEFYEYLLTPLRKPRDNTPHRSKTPEPNSIPKFLTLPQGKVAEKGEQVRFQCIIDGHPTPSTKWYKYNVPIIPDRRVRIYEDDERKELEIFNVSKDDEGLYRVEIKNEKGRSEATVRLDVLYDRRTPGKSNVSSRASNEAKIMASGTSF